MIGTGGAELVGGVVSMVVNCSADQHAAPPRDGGDGMNKRIDALSEAIAGSVAKSGPNGIAALALVVDGDFQTVYGAIASQGFLDDEGDETVLLMPFDWDIECHSLRSPAPARASRNSRTHWQARATKNAPDG